MRLMRLFVVLDGRGCRSRDGSTPALVDRAALERGVTPVLEKIGFRKDHTTTDDHGDVVYLVRDL